MSAHTGKAFVGSTKFIHKTGPVRPVPRSEGICDIVTVSGHLMAACVGCRVQNAQPLGTGSICFNLLFFSPSQREARIPPG